MAQNDARMYGDRWRVVREIGRGGQGVVYEVVDATRTEVASHISTIRTGLGKIGLAAGTPEERFNTTIELVNGLREVLKEDNRQRQRGALKELLPIDEAVNAQTALERMRMELETLQSVNHPALIKILDNAISERWFVTEYFPNGTLADEMERYKGKVPDALVAFRPVVDAVSALHAKKIVHRDIKTDNIFVGRHDQLVLGDCGLAFKLDTEERITDTFENVGTRDWMPRWAMGLRLADVKSNFDVFSLGKMLWSMISGQEKLQLWYHRKPRFDLATMFPGNESIPFVQTILDKTVVEDPENCIRDAHELLRLVDRTIEALTMRFRIVNGDLIRRCLVCGRGQYCKIVDHDVDAQRNFGLEVVSQPKFRIFVCDGCGHTQMFYSADGVRPPVWKS